MEDAKTLNIDNVKENENRKNFDMDEHLSDNIHNQTNTDDLLSNNQIHGQNEVFVNESIGEEHAGQNFPMSPPSEKPVKYQTEIGIYSIFPTKYRIEKCTFIFIKSKIIYTIFHISRTKHKPKAYAIKTRRSQTSDQCTNQENGKKQIYISMLKF